MKRAFLYFAGLILLMSSCTVKEELTFNNDFSGSGVFSYNLALFGSEDDIDSAMIAQIAMAEEYKAAALEIPGISNVEYKITEEEEEEAFMFINFDFNGLAALNALYKLDIFEEAPFLRKTFKKKIGKRLSVSWPVHALTQEDRESYEDEMMDLYTYDLTLTLPGQLKKSSIDTDKIEVVTDQKRVYFKGNWGDFYTHITPVTWKGKI